VRGNAAAVPLAHPPGRQGPGPMPGALVEALDLVLARRAAGALPGERRAAGRGTGTELMQIRPYQPGDDVRRLDAAASARTGLPHVRDMVPERTLTTWIVLDVSASMAWGTAARLKSDVAEGVAHVVGRLAVRRAGRVALVTCGAPEVRLLAPGAGRTALVALRRALAAGVAPDGRPPAPDALARTLRRVALLARGPGLVVVISDFREGAPGGNVVGRQDIEAEARVLSGKPVDDSGDKADRDGDRRGDPHLSCRRIGKEFDIAYRLPEFIENGGSSADHQPTEFGCLHAVRVTIKQRHAQHVLEVCDSP